MSGRIARVEVVAAFGVLFSSVIASVAAAQLPRQAAAPDFNLNCTPGPFNVPRGGTANGGCSLLSTEGFTGPVFLTCLGAPPGIDCAFLPDPVNLPPNGPGSSQVTISVNLTALPGTYTFDIEGRSGPLTHTSPLQVTVPPPDFSFNCSPSYLTIPQWDDGVSQCDVTPSNGFVDEVHFACLPPLGGITCAFVNETVNVPTVNGSRIIFYIPFYHATGLVNLTLQAANETAQRNATVTVNVTKSTTHEIKGIRPLDQHDPRVSNNTAFRDSACAPTSEAMAAIAAGFRKDQNGDGKFDEDDMYILVQKIAAAKGTNAEDGTDLWGEETGMRSFLNASGEGGNYTVKLYKPFFELLNKTIGNDVPVVLILERSNSDGTVFRHKLIAKDVDYKPNADGTNTVSLVDPWDGSNLTTKWDPKGARILYDADGDGKPDVVKVKGLEVIEKKSGGLRAFSSSLVEWMPGHVVGFANGTDYVIEAPVYGHVYVSGGIVYGLPLGGNLWEVNGSATPWANGTVEINGTKLAVTYDVDVVDGGAWVNSSALWRFPSMPQNFNYSSSGADVSLSWDPPVHSRGALIGYQVLRLNPDGSVTVFSTLATDYIDAPPGLDYYNYSVAAVNGNGTGLATDELMFNAGLPELVSPLATFALVAIGAALVAAVRRRRPQR